MAKVAKNLFQLITSRLNKLMVHNHDHGLIACLRQSKKF